MSEKPRCMYYNWARHQRESELKRGEGFEGTRAYEVTGCYKCNGYNTKCPYYEVAPKRDKR